jgi:hypothetical protein
MFEQPSMIDRSTSTPLGSGAGERADALRETLRGLRDVDNLLAEAARLRREAAAEADQLVAEAQSVSAELLGEAEARATAIVTEAHAEAEGATSRLNATLGEIEGGVLELGGHLEGALRSVNSLARTIERVRVADEPPPPAPPAPLAEEPTAHLPEVVHHEHPVAGEARSDAMVEHVQRSDDPRDDAGARPLGWLFRATPAG